MKPRRSKPGRAQARTIIHTKSQKPMRQPRKATAPKPRPEGAIRLNARLRDLGIASRREADELIEAGKIFVNGKRAELGTTVTEDDAVEFAGTRPKAVYLAYNKPRGLPTQGMKNERSVISDWRGRGIFPVGRLDKDSSGLLILTNDGRATARLLGTNIDKEYEVKTRGPIRSGIPAVMASGMHVHSLGTLLPADAQILDTNKIRITLREGKKHQVRIMLAELGHVVTDLVRTRIGPVHLSGIAGGSHRDLTQRELDTLGIGD